MGDGDDGLLQVFGDSTGVCGRAHLLYSTTSHRHLPNSDASRPTPVTTSSPSSRPPPPPTVLNSTWYAVGRRNVRAHCG